MDVSSGVNAGRLAGVGWLPLFVFLAVFLFLPTVASVKDAGSILWLLLVFVGFRYTRSGWKVIGSDEKRVLLGFVALLLVTTMSLVNSEDYANAWDRIERFARIALLIPVYLLFRSNGISAGRALLLGAAAAGPVMALHGLYQAGESGARASGYYYAILFGDIAVLSAGVAVVAALFVVRNRWGRLLLVASAALAVFASVLSVSRGAWITVPAFLLFALWLYRKRISGRTWLAALVASAIVVGAGTSITQVREGFSRGISEIQTFVDDPAKFSSWGVRINLWRNSLLIAKESPFLGTGIGDFPLEMQQMVADGRSLSPHVQNYRHAHNIYLDALANSGVLGLLALVAALFYLPFRFFHRQWIAATDDTVRFYSLGGMLTLVAFAVFGLTEGWLTRHAFVVSYVVCVAVFMSGLANSVDAKRAGSD